MAMKKILIPTDFSKEAQNAAEVASKIARKFNSELVFLHSIEVTSTESIMPAELRQTSIHTLIPCWFTNLFKGQMRK